MSEIKPKTQTGNMLTPTNISTNTTIVGNMTVPSMAPQKLNNSGSATGNPRNKCALKPGHSLMDWIRLGNSGEDLSGTHGAVIPVSGEELIKHNTRNDAWMAIRGKVYNVTRYMDFHPGGVDELMRGVGTDATKLFNEVHAWVNYEQLLAKSFIGPLRGNIVKIDTNIFKSIKDDTKIKLNPNTKTEQNVANNFLIPQTLPQRVSGTTEIIPRFDWIQNRSDVTFYFYTRQFCNPGLIVQRKDANSQILLIRIFIDLTTHVFEFELHAAINWPPRVVKIFSETGKVELTFTKTTKELWPTYGTHTGTKVAQFEDIEHNFKIVKNEMFNHDSFALTLRAETETLMRLPVGYHISLTLTANVTTTRSYTSVPCKFFKPTETNEQNDISNLELLIKCYKHGLLSQPLQQMNSSENDSSSALLHLSQPKGSLKLRQLVSHNRIALLAAGSGITPMLSLIEHLLQRSTNRIEKLLLYFFNKTEADIWCRQALNNLQTSDERFQFVNILSQPDETWKGATGRINKELLTPLTDRNSTEYVSYLCICGPNAFNQTAVEILKSKNIAEDNVHVFQ